jgi:hypothetical protein
MHMKTFTRSKLVIIITLIMAFQFVACEKTEIDNRRKFRGTYNVEEYSFNGNRVSLFESRISIVEFSDDEIVISNFFGVGIDVYAVVLGSKIFIPDQEIGNFEIWGGQGSLTSNNTIEMDYSVTVTFPNSEPTTDFLEATYVKKF